MQQGFLDQVEIMLSRAATIQLPHYTIRITLFALRYDTYRDTFLTILEP